MSDVIAPMSGTVLEINEEVVDAPEILNQSPYEDGWLIKVRLSRPQEEADLMSAEDYEKMLAEAAE